jgi:feruloyl esterase
MRLFCLLAIGAVAFALCPGLARAADCGGLSGRKFGGSLVVETNEVTPPFIATSMGPRGVTVATPFCRVRGLSRPTADSNIYFEVWLPPAESWNGRYQATAPGSFLGSMPLSSMPAALKAGYATSATDNGHVGNDAREWSSGHPERVTDWGWRAVHETSVASKAIIAAYYGRRPSYSYFLSCSKGGGSALMEAQRFPTDYNGIAAGAPGWDISGQFAKYVFMLQAAARPGGWISPAKIKLLHDAVLVACGARDGVIDDPGACEFDPTSLQCTRGASDGCLTAEQVKTALQIYRGPTDSNGQSIFPGNPLGSELAWSALYMGSQDNPGVSADRMSGAKSLYGILYGKPLDDLMSLDVEEIFNRSKQEQAKNWDAVDPDLSAFNNADGKLIIYHGLYDVNVPPDTRYPQMVRAKMGGDVSQFMRLFLGPGMEHCGGGVGPNAIGAVGGGPAAAADADHDIVAALARWVEQGVAPDQIIATKYVDDDPAKGVAAQRPWCVYPAIARYSGQGDRRRAVNWSCRRPVRPPPSQE